MNDPFYVIGPDGDVRRWNDRLPEVTGFSDAEIAEMEASDFSPEDQEARNTDAIEETLRRGHVVVESELLTVDGDRIPCWKYLSRRLCPGYCLVIAGVSIRP